MDETARREVERRTFLRHAGTAVWATPLILTMASSRASAQSCAPDGSTCGNYIVLAGVGPICQVVPGAPLCCGVCTVDEVENACRCVAVD